VATYQLAAKLTRSPVRAAFLAIVAFHGLAAIGIFLATRPDGVRPPSLEVRGADMATDAQGVPLTPPAPLPPPVAPVQPAAPAVSAVPPEVLAAPAVVRQAPVVPLPSDPEDRAEVLADVRQRRLAKMLEQRMRRSGQ
jgi:hypothetical protein